VESGAMPILGDIATPQQWIARLPQVDGIIHAA
jgi:hypothetical protein